MSQYRPVHLNGVEIADVSDSKPTPVAPEPALAEVLGHDLNIPVPETDTDSTILNLDRNYHYTVWLSYAEVYNEKVYDLLDSVKTKAGDAIPKSNINPLLVTRKALPLRSSPPSDGDGKYIAGLRQFRVLNASQAKGLIKLGNVHRQVFGTLANRESSRSHALVFLKVVRVHRGEQNVFDFLFCSLDAETLLGSRIPPPIKCLD